LDDFKNTFMKKNNFTIKVKIAKFEEILVV